MSFTNYFENKVLAYALSGTAYTPPTLYAALFTAAPGETGGGTEVAGSGYTRMAMPFTTSGSTSSNTSVTEWPTATGAGWGTVTHIALFDAATSGNMLDFAPLTAARTIFAGDVFRVPAGNYQITLD